MHNKKILILRFPFGDSSSTYFRSLQYWFVIFCICGQPRLHLLRLFPQFAILVRINSRQAVTDSSSMCISTVCNILHNILCISRHSISVLGLSLFKVILPGQLMFQLHDKLTVTFPLKDFSISHFHRLQYWFELTAGRQLQIRLQCVFQPMFQLHVKLTVTFLFRDFSISRM